MQNSSLQSSDFSVTDALRGAVMALQDAHIETASLDARVLLEHVLNVSREELLAGRELSLTQAQDTQYQALIEKRKLRQPVSQLIGRREFWGMQFKVTQATLDPRPDSETLIEAVLATRKDRGRKWRLLDLGTGSGCLLLSLLKEYTNAEGVGVDISGEALKVARENAVSLGLQARAAFAQGCWDDAVEGTFDIIVSNPPYIPTSVIPTLAKEVYAFEPRQALDGGKDGLDCYRDILPRLQKRLAKDGLAVLEIGIGQQDDIGDLAQANGLQVAEKKEDLAGIVRCILLKH